MKWKLATLFLLLHSPAFADYFNAQTGHASFAQSKELQNYVRTIAAYPLTRADLKARLEHTVDYYRRVHIVKTITKKNYTVDCIPFAEQPALIDRPILSAQLLPKIIEETKKNLSSLIKTGNLFDFNAAKSCPLGSVAIMRPSKAMLTNETATKKMAPQMISSKAQSAAGYTWEQGQTPDGQLIYIPTLANQAYFKGPQNQYVTPSAPSDHSLNQFWYTTEVFNSHPRETFTYSVEFGIINSAYFTDTPSTSIFVFASIDNYGAASCYNLYCPNFIQTPGSIPLGAPIANNNADYIFQVKHITSPGIVAGYYLTLLTHQPGSKTLVGYYPDALYAPANRPTKFSAGAEVYAEAPGNGTLMAGNYANPYAGYTGPKEIGLFSQNGNNFPYSTAYSPPPYGLIWQFGQSS